MKYEHTNIGKNTISVIEDKAHDWLHHLEIIDFELVLYKSYLQANYSANAGDEKSAINSLISYICEHIEENKLHLRTCLYYKKKEFRKSWNVMMWNMNKFIWMHILFLKNGFRIILHKLNT